MRVRAVLAVAQRPVTVAGISAAAIWGMPIAGTWPTEVTILDQWRGGGRSEFGVRRTAAGYRTARVAELDGMPVTTLSRTALDVARSRSLSDAMGSVDWARWRKNERAVTKEMLSEELESFDSKVGFRHLENVINPSTSLSDSFGESEARVGIHLLGFAPPELQVELRDLDGRMLPDFAWLAIRKLAEFDGKMKYSRDAYTAGNPADVVWKEKKREDRLRRMDFQVTRILTEDVKHPVRLERLLSELGVPRIGTRGGR